MIQSDQVSLKSENTLVRLADYSESVVKDRDKWGRIVYKKLKLV